MPSSAPSQCDTPGALVSVSFRNAMDGLRNEDITDCPFACLEFCRDEPTQDWDVWGFLPGTVCICLLGVSDPEDLGFTFFVDFFDPADRAALGL